MMCDNCRERDAVIAVTHVKNNVVSQLHLCEKCAAEQGVEMSFTSAPKHPLGEFLQAVHQQLAPVGGSADTAKCTFCGMTMADFKTAQRWGCARCYGQFEAAIRELLRRVHGNSRHVGRVYQLPESPELRQQAVLGELKERLRRAIEKEDFEAAAGLRDRIRVLE
jgi:protein arginine kinase activator